MVELVPNNPPSVSQGPQAMGMAAAVDEHAKTASATCCYSNSTWYACHYKQKTITPRITAGDQYYSSIVVSAYSNRTLGMYNYSRPLSAVWLGKGLRFCSVYSSRGTAAS